LIENWKRKVEIGMLKLENANYLRIYKFIQNPIRPLIG
jgi:hypothetical protein